MEETKGYDLIGDKWCISLNIMMFEKLQKRINTEEDKQLGEFFKKELGFKVMNFPEDTKASYIKDSLSNLSRLFGGVDPKCFALIISSHGGHGQIHCYDEKITYKEINDCLSKNTCLKNRPKLIYIQACRTKKINDPMENKCLFEDFVSRDMFVMLAALRETSAKNYNIIGSYFIGAICTVYREQKNKIDVLRLAADINRQLNDQAICFTSLTKRLTLPRTE